MNKQITLLFIVFSFFVELQAQWTFVLYLKHPIRNKTDSVRVWYNTPKIKGFVLSGSIGNAKTFCVSNDLRNTLQNNELAIVYIRTQQYGMSIFDPSKDSAFLNFILDTVAKRSGKSEFRYAPWALFGHSTDGLFVQNIAVWKPSRVFSMLSYKSGNLGNTKNMFAPWTKLDPIKNIPFLAINGRYEEFGPNGPLPGCSSPFPPQCYTQTQWLASRDSLIKLRSKGYLMNLIVDHYGSANHNSWSIESGMFMSKFIEKAAKAKIPAGYPTSAPYILNKINENAYFLSDSSISHIIDKSNLPCYPVEAEYDRFPINKQKIAFWQFDKSISVDWINFHHNKWSAYEPPISPSSLDAISISDKQINLSWIDQSSNETWFIIERKKSGTSFEKIDSVAPNSTNFNSIGLQSNTNYNYRIYARNTQGFSSYSNIDSATTLVTKLKFTDKNTSVIFKQYPDIIEINSEVNAAVYIYSILGNTIYQNTINANETLKINISKQIKGVYILKINNLSKKFIIQ